MPTTEKPLRIGDVSDITGLPEATLRYFRYLGQGPPSFKIGRRIMYDRADVEKWLEDQKQATRSGESSCL